MVQPIGLGLESNSKALRGQQRRRRRQGDKPRSTRGWLGGGGGRKRKKEASDGWREPWQRSPGRFALRLAGFCTCV